MPSDTDPPLDGIRVLDFSRIIAGPLCAQQLGDLGADVIKVENPVTGDETRRQAEPRVGEDSHFFLAFNRTKKSIAVDVRAGDGKAIAEGLIAEADVLVENFRPGVMQRLGLDYASVAEINPRLIYVSFSAYGETGSLSDRPGFDPVIQAESGIMSMTGEPDGPPLRHPIAIIDTLAALHAAGAVMAALIKRAQSGRGQHVEVALYDVAIAALGNPGLYYLTGGEAPPRAGNSHPVSTPVNLFPTKTGPIYLATATDRLFRKLCEDVLERPDLADDPRFATTNDRFQNRPALFEIIIEIFTAQPREYWLAKMYHLPSGAMQTLAEALESDFVMERGMIKTVEHPTGPVRIFASPIRLSETPVRKPTAPPLLGEHTDELLGELLGYDDDRIARLRADGVIR
ncbi:MAG: CoA transferase [Alphaproteobacteria bacterium]|nr:CoA transferase [Alphaproteobacteria bacterium]